MRESFTKRGVPLFSTIAARVQLQIARCTRCNVCGVKVCSSSSQLTWPVSTAPLGTKTRDPLFLRETYATVLQHLLSSRRSHFSAWRSYLVLASTAFAVWIWDKCTRTTIPSVACRTMVAIFFQTTSSLSQP